jgi:hypothetical protein
VNETRGLYCELQNIGLEMVLVYIILVVVYHSFCLDWRGTEDNNNKQINKHKNKKKNSFKTVCVRLLGI